MKKRATLPFTWAMQQAPDGLTTTDKLVLAVLASFADKDGTHVYPSRQTLANYTGLSPRTITRSIKNLLDGGWIRKGDQKFASRYRPDRRPIVYEIVLTRKPGEVAKMQVDEHGVDIADDETPAVERVDIRDSNGWT